ncbi:MULTISPECIES: hypothetical protein [Mycobacterium]|uniref:hypothetical protein n=1 Tax=Mycobacterium TaxID=1763 RepID=UPI001EEF9FE5|nr:MULTISPECIES: hypothetical protein [Mycobacterium]BDB44563.1 hypothetical protein IWGMT90018_50090 [Mycobacterium kiyosense]BDE16068.1 hypothetical protein MKCMC460_49280 [Mycobacterium sp. 20KCMC460]GLB92705.1 hypothetical protein SRL2020130_55220 [Mycobacterium kiyosense]GLC04933.1 hypothetical protein SRL2020400_55240 [Mycobacterium kiyosense]GLC10840.1 hypothetical protein SRL2020411_54860 [Mycobacterium kiyosense]
MTATLDDTTTAAATPAPSVIGLADWEVWQYAQRLSPLTVAERLRLIRRFRDETGIQPLRAEPLDISRWLASHTEWSDSTAATYTSYLAAWFKWLADHGPPPRQPDDQGGVGEGAGS